MYRYRWLENKFKKGERYNVKKCNCHLLPIKISFVWYPYLSVPDNNIIHSVIWQHIFRLFGIALLKKFRYWNVIIPVADHPLYDLWCLHIHQIFMPDDNYFLILNADIPGYTAAAPSSSFSENDKWTWRELNPCPKYPPSPFYYHSLWSVIPSAAMPQTTLRFQ